MTKFGTLFSSSVQKVFSSKKLFLQYEKSLQTYWSGESAKTLELVAKNIDKSKGEEGDSHFYRLWIEQLAELGDKSSLSFLQRHFVRMQGSNCLSDDTLQAFRGLIHLELDEIEFSKHLYKLLKDVKDNQYAFEFCLRFSLRFSKDGAENFLFPSKKNVFSDFFVYKTFAQVSLVSRNDNLLNKVLSFVSHSFFKCPLEKEFSFYKHLDFEAYKEANSVLNSLIKDFKYKTEYQFLKGYVLSCLGEFEKSSKVLLNLEKKMKHEDVDVFSLLAFNSLHSSFGNIRSKHWKNAIEYFLKTESLLSKNGMSGKDAILSLSLIQRKESLDLKKQDDRTSFHYWLVNLKASEFSSLIQGKKEENSYLFQKMGSLPREGDLVFFVSAENGKSQARLASFYEVISSPTWDHQNGYETMLQLVRRFDETIPLSNEFLYEEGECFLEFEKDFSYKLEKGSYLLSSKGLNVLSQEILERSEDKKLKTFFQELLLKKA